MPFWEKGPSEKEYVSHSPDGHDGHDIVHVQDGEVSENADNLQRRLNNRQIQLIAIGGSIGTALFVSIGGGLHQGGPGSLFIAYTIYACMLALVNNCIAEMTVQYPVSGGFIRLAGHFVDDAVGFMAGWNFFIYEALLIPFEITALTLVLGFWSENIPGWAVPVACIVSSGGSSRFLQPKLTCDYYRSSTGKTSPSATAPIATTTPIAPCQSCHAHSNFSLSPAHHFSIRAEPLRHTHLHRAYPSPMRLAWSQSSIKSPVSLPIPTTCRSRQNHASLSMSAR